MKTSITFAAAAAALLIAGGAQAQSAGTWLVKGGINTVVPDVKSGDLSAPSLPGTKIDVKEATSVILTGAYMLTDNISVEGYAGLGYKHDVTGEGAIGGAGRIGTVKQVAPTVLAQYRFFAPNDRVRPYVGLGLTYAIFYGEEGSGKLTSFTAPGSSTPTSQKVDNAFGVAPQIGVTVALQDRWFLDASVIKAFLKTTTHLSTGQSIDTRLDPTSVNVSLGYRF